MSGTATRTIWHPAAVSSAICCSVALTSAVLVVHIDCTLTGKSLPTPTLPADEDRGARNELADIVLMFVAEGASERTRGMFREGPHTLAQRSGISLGAVRVPAPGCACSAAADPFSTHGSVRASVRMPI